MDLFVYGTLRHLPLFEIVAGLDQNSDVGISPARLYDHAVDRVEKSDLPMLVARDGGIVDGLVLSGLSETQRARLDLYEVAFGYDVRAVEVARDGGIRSSAEAYFPPDRQQSSGQPWSLPEWESKSAQAALFAAQEGELHQPRLTGSEMFAQWKMAQGRAEAKVRAVQNPGPARVRYDAKPEDIRVEVRAPLFGSFFKLAQCTIQHRTFDGGLSEGLPREIFMGCDAALVLPYDVDRDRILMVEQFRCGPAVRNDPNPWSLEPVAGIIDPGETPEMAATREAQEEAALAVTNLEHMFSIYASPGSSTDHFHCFLGRAELPSLDVGFGGLEEEAEDLRLHVLGLDEALDLIDTSEIQAGPMVAMLLWLSRKRATIGK